MMSDEILTSAAHDAPVLVRSESERLVELRIMPWGVVGSTREGPERFRRGAFRGVKPEDVALEAIGPHGAEPGVRLAGRAVELEDRDDGEYGTFRVSRTRAGDELLELARDGVYRAASAVFSPIASRFDGGVIERQTARLVRVGIVESGAYPGAAVLAVRSAGGSTVPAETNPQPEPEPEPAPDPTPGGLRVAVDSPEMLGRMDDLRRDLLGRMASLEAVGTGRAGGPHPLARWATFGEYLADASGDPATAVLLARALADQATVDNPGVTPPTYLQEVFGIIAGSRPAISGFGGPRSLGDSGMSLHFPYFDGNLLALVAKQAAEKTDIASVKVSLKDGSFPVETFAGGSDISYQLIRRSSPSYLEAYGRIMLAAWALITEREFELAVWNGGTGSIVFVPIGATDAALRAAFFHASSLVKAATGSPATVALAASDVFASIGGLLVPPAYGTSNVTGTAQASTLRINVSGLEVVEGPDIPAGQMLFSNESAAGWHEDGPMVATAEDVARLGQNRAYWSMGAAGIYVPAGIVKTSAVAGDAARSAKR
jgi:HK97 family phage prohead protease